MKTRKLSLKKATSLPIAWRDSISRSIIA
jgi:hypothetical protein